MEEKTQYSDDSWGGLILKSQTPGAAQGPTIEASRRVVRALEASARSADRLGRWILILTVVIMVLTGVQVLIGLQGWPYTGR